MEKPEITEAISLSYAEVNAWLGQQPLERFEKGPEGKWNTSEHLDHIIKTAQLITKALKYPKFILRYKFGKPNRPVRSRQEIIDRYKERLANIPPGTTTPIKIQGYSESQKEMVMDKLEKANLRLIDAINKWPEKKLDQFLLPHPLMGRMIVRELLIWHGYHNIHHLNILKDKY